LDLASLEVEALLLGKWKNIEELEEFISLPELEAILAKAREKERDHQKFLAAIQGIDLDKYSQEEAEDAFNRVQRRAQARLTGMSQEMIEHAEFGMEFEIED